MTQDQLGGVAFGVVAVPAVAAFLYWKIKFDWWQQDVMVQSLQESPFRNPTDLGSNADEDKNESEL